MNPNIRANEIMTAFQRYLSSNGRTEISSFTLKELRSADEQYGDRDVNAGFRIALRNRIKEIEERNEQRLQSYIRVIGYIVTFGLGYLVAYFTK